MAGAELDVVEPLPGTVAALSPFEAEEVVVDVARTGDGWSWVGDGLAGWVRADVGGPVEAGIGAMRWRTVDGPSPFEPVDLTQRWSIAAPVGPEPRRRKIGRFRVDGEERVILSTWPAELPIRPPPAVAPGGEVADFAADAVVGARSEWEAASMLVKAVADRLDDGPMTGAMSAEEVLERGAGDCSEHVTLLRAAAGRLGWRSRVVAGLVAMETGAIGGGLYPHVWAEIELSGRWVAVDPTLGVAPADAARVPLDPLVERAMDRLAGGLVVEIVELR